MFMLVIARNTSKTRRQERGKYNCSKGIAYRSEFLYLTSQQAKPKQTKRTRGSPFARAILIEGEVNYLLWTVISNKHNKISILISRHLSRQKLRVYVIIAVITDPDFIFTHVSCYPRSPSSPLDISRSSQNSLVLLIIGFLPQAVAVSVLGELGRQRIPR